jgi:hypothetical protein
MGKIEVPKKILTQCLFLLKHPTWIGLGLKPRLRDDSQSTNRLWLEFSNVAWVMSSMTKFCVAGVNVNDLIIGEGCCFVLGTFQLFLLFVYAIKKESFCFSSCVWILFFYSSCCCSKHCNVYKICICIRCQLFPQLHRAS